MITLDASFNRQWVKACVGDLLRLDLPEDAMAGARWAISDALPAQLRLLSDKTVGQRASAAERRLEFRVVLEGKFALSLVSPRACRREDAAFEVYVEVRSA